MGKRKASSVNDRFIGAALHDIGLLVHIPAFMSLPVLIVSMISGEWFAVKPVLLMAVISLLAGQGLRRFSPNMKSLSQRPLSMVVVSFSWLIVVLLGAIPFLGIALSMPVPNASVMVFQDFSNAFFESMSGFTSTGLSVAPDASTLPASLQFWRSLMEWVGGAGVVLLALLMIEPAEDAKNLYVAEVRKTLFDNSIKKTVKWIWIIYGAYTVFAILLFRIVGMPFWEALNHGLTAISTGGFTVTRDSFAQYSGLIKMAGNFIVIIGALSFHSHYYFWVKKDRSFPFRQSQVRTFLGCWGAGILLFSLIKLSFGHALTASDYLFEWTSALGTCGFSALPLASAHKAFLLLLIAGMIIGGCSGSTTGGIKTNRFLWALKAFIWRMKSVWKHGKRNISFNYDQKRVSQKQGILNVESTGSLILLWFAVLFVSSFILLLILGNQFSFLHILFDSASALGSVGLSTGVVSASLPSTCKYLFSLLMWMGRLEIIAVLIFFSMPKIYLDRSGKK